MRFVKRDHMVQKVTPTALDPSLRDSVLPRTLKGGSDWRQTHRADGHGDFQTELGVAIKDQESRSRLKRKRFSELLNDPCTRGVPS